MEYEYSTSGSGFGILAVLIMLIIGLAVYLFFAYCIKMIAEKTGHSDRANLAWIPIAQQYLLVKIAERETIWFILMFVPLINIIASILVWMDVATRRGHESYWGIITAFIPFVGIPYLAFAKGNEDEVAI